MLTFPMDSETLDSEVVVVFDWSCTSVGVL